MRQSTGKCVNHVLALPVNHVALDMVAATTWFKRNSAVCGVYGKKCRRF